MRLSRSSPRVSEVSPHSRPLNHCICIFRLLQLRTRDKPTWIRSCELLFRAAPLSRSSRLALDIAALSGVSSLKLQSSKWHPLQPGLIISHGQVVRPQEFASVPRKPVAVVTRSASNVMPASVACLAQGAKRDKFLIAASSSHDGGSILASLDSNSPHRRARAQVPALQEMAR